MTDQTKRLLMTEEIWLNYFNNYLYDQRVITEDERNRMSNQIAARSANKWKTPERGR